MLSPDNRYFRRGTQVRSICFSIAMLAATSVAAQEAPDFSGAYYCKMSASAGLRLDPQVNQWKPTVFSTEDEAYTIRVTKTGEILETTSGKTPTYFVSIGDFGKDDKPDNCFGLTGRPIDKSEYIEIGNSGHMECRYLGNHYIINFTAKRMMVQFRGGYMDTWRENTDTPYVAIGKCDKVG